MTSDDQVRTCLRGLMIHTAELSVLVDNRPETPASKQTKAAIDQLLDAIDGLNAELRGGGGGNETP